MVMSYHALHAEELLVPLIFAGIICDVAKKLHVITELEMLIFVGDGETIYIFDYSILFGSINLSLFDFIFNYWSK